CWYQILDPNCNPCKDLKSPKYTEIHSLITTIDDIDARHLLTRLLELDSNRRPSWQWIRRAPFFRNTDWGAVKARINNPIPTFTPNSQAKRVEGYSAFANNPSLNDCIFRNPRPHEEGMGRLDVNYNCPPQLWRDEKH
ncbi:hypothetical protein BJ138DRAFT_1101096, partial [Hygrophoropsis aurantiaca]